VRQPVHLLIVGADSVLAGSMSALASDICAECEFAASSQAALDLFRTKRPEIVLVSAELEEDGACALIRTLLSNDTGVLIAVFGTKAQLLLEAVKAGAADFLLLPFRASDCRVLLDKFLHVVERRRERMFVTEHLRGASIQFSLESSKSAIAPAVNTIKELLRGLVAPAELARIDLALQEVLTNAYEHGNLGLSYEEKMSFCENETLEKELERRAVQARHEGKVIRVAALLDPDYFTVNVTDDGAGFDWRNAPNPLENPEKLLSLHGRGLLIAHRSFDKVEFNEAGNSITLTFKIRERGA
jgi:anti-sigma regulatory factor (Ser/Thr protein kinase)/FixJ family two-component response regulator